MAGTRLYLGKSNFQRNMKTAGSRGGEDERGAGGGGWGGDGSQRILVTV